MNRKQRRASEKRGRQLQKKPWTPLREVTDQAIAKQKALRPNSTFRPDLVFQNSKYIAQLFFKAKRKGETYCKVMCRRSDAMPIYSWSDLFAIKNQIFGEETEAVQFMPKVSELTDVANLYWFFVPFEGGVNEFKAELYPKTRKIETEAQTPTRQISPADKGQEISNQI